MHDEPTPTSVDPAQLGFLPAEAPPFDGEAYDKAMDLARLTGQIRRVKQILLVGDWLTLGEIQERTQRPENWRGDPEASISAQIRHLRKVRFGSHVIEKRRRGDTGLFEYRMEGDR